MSELMPYPDGIYHENLDIIIHNNNEEEKYRESIIPLPMELIGNIFLYMKSRTVEIFKDSIFYRHDLPFLLLSKRARVPCHYLSTTMSFEKCMAEYVYNIYFKIASNVHPRYNKRIALFYIYRNYDSPRKYSKDLGVNVREPYFDLLVRHRHHRHICQLHNRRRYQNWREFNNSSRRHVLFSMMGVWGGIIFVMFIGALIYIILS